MNCFNNADLPGMVGDRVEKINSSYKLDEFDKKRAALDALKTKLRSKRLEEAKALQKRITRLETKLLSQISFVDPKEGKDSSPESKKQDNGRAEQDSTPTPSNKNDKPATSTGPVDPAEMFSKEFQDLAHELKQATAEYVQVKKKIVSDQANYFNNIYYLTFKTKEIHDEVLKRYGSNDNWWSNLFSAVNKSHIQGIDRPIQFRMKQAPEPADILWHNLSATKCQKFCARIVTFFLTGVLIALGFGVVLGLKILQRSIGKNLTATSSLDRSVIQFRALSVAISFVVTFINTLLPMLMRRLTQYEKQTTNTDFFKSLTFKIAIVTSTNKGPIHQHEPCNRHHPRYHHVP